MAYDVFISYAREDVQIVDRIEKELEKYDISCFIDRSEIALGDDFAEIIAKSIFESEIMLFIWSENSNQSENTANEIALAIDFQKTIVSFKIGEFTPHYKLAYRLVRFNRIDAITFNETQIIELGEKIGKRLGKAIVPKKAKEKIIPPSTEENPVYQNDYDMGKQALIKYDLNTAFSDLLEPALHNYKDSQALFAQIIESRERVWKIDDEKFESVLKSADNGNAFAQHIMSIYYLFKENDSEKGFEYTRKSADQGDSYGMFQLAKCYDLGSGTGRDKRKYNELIRKAIALNNPFAILYLAKDNLFGWSGKKNAERGRNLLEKAVALDYPSAMIVLAQQYWEGVSVSKDFEKAETLVKKAISLGHIEGYEKLGNFYMYEPVSYKAKEDKRGFEYYMKGAEYDESNCLSSIAQCYLTGFAIKKDPQNAIKWFTKAAKAGDRFAYYMLGWMYYYGNDVEENEALAWEYLKKGEKMVSGNCSYMLGIMCLEGYAQEGQEKKDAVCYFEESAYLGGNLGEESMIKLFEIYSQGELVEKNERKALEWLKTAAELDNPTALLKYGDILTDLDSSYSDEFKGIRYLKRALEKDNFGAACQLGNLYRKGIGMIEDREKAKEMYLVAADKANHAQAHCNYAKMHCHIPLLEWDEPLVNVSDEQAEKDHALAQIHFEIAAELNLEEAFARLYEITLHQYELSGKTNENMALQCFRYASDAVEKEYPLGLLMLGECYKNGIGTAINAKKAIEYFKKAHDKSNKSGSFRIAEIYNEGKIIQRNIAKAIYWYKESLALGNTTVNEELKKIQSEEIIAISKWETYPDFNKIDDYVELVFKEVEDKSHKSEKINKFFQPYINLTDFKSVSIEDLDVSVKNFHTAWKGLVDSANYLKKEIPLSVLKVSDMVPWLSYSQIKSLRKELAVLWLNLKKEHAVLQDVNLNMDNEILDIAEIHETNSFVLLLISIVECNIELESVESQNNDLFLKLQAIDNEKEINSFGKNKHETLFKLADKFYRRGSSVKQYYAIAKSLYEQAPYEPVAKERLLEIENVLKPM